MSLCSLLPGIEAAAVRSWPALETASVAGWLWRLEKDEFTVNPLTDAMIPQLALQS